MFKILSKKAWIVIIIAVIVILVGSVLAYQYLWLSKEQTCVNSGGTISTSLCCQLTDDFPNTCLIGACGCSPDHSHSVKICDCGENKCFNGRKCVSQ